MTKVVADIRDVGPDFKLKDEHTLVVLEPRPGTTDNPTTGYRIPVGRVRGQLLADVGGELQKHIADNMAHPAGALPPGSDMATRVLAQVAQWEKTLGNHVVLGNRVAKLEASLNALTGQLAHVRGDVQRETETAIAAESEAKRHTGQSSKALADLKAQVSRQEVALKAVESGLKELQTQAPEISRSIKEQEARNQVTERKAQDAFTNTTGLSDRLGDVEEQLPRIKESLTNVAKSADLVRAVDLLSSAIDEQKRSEAVQ